MTDNGPVEVRTSRLPSSEPITWAGKGRRSGEICFATESGRLRFVDFDLNPTSELSPVFGSGEAINGAVFVEDLLAVSTRSEVVVFMKSDHKYLESLYSGGAHTIITSEENKIIAPRGTEGLLCIQRQRDGRYARKTIKVSGEEPYFYQTVPLGKETSGQELFASACRTDGLVLTSIGPDHFLGEMRVMAPKEMPHRNAFDAVGLCGLGSTDYPFAVALLGMDGSTHFSRDVRSGYFELMIPEKMRGTPYSIHCAQGHLFILTSEKIYALRDMARYMLQTHSNTPPPEAVSFEVDAVDCAVINNERLLIIQDDGLAMMAISDLFMSFPTVPTQSFHHSISAFRSTLSRDSVLTTEIMEFV